jgi:uridine kinase
MDMDPNYQTFTEHLYHILCHINPGIAELELYEFCYALSNITPEIGWNSVNLLKPEDIEAMINQKSFFTGIQFKPVKDGRVVLDAQIARLTQMLCIGLVSGAYSVTWINQLFYFDIRAFVFFVRTHYFNRAIREHFGGSPLLQLTSGQTVLESKQDLGLREFQAANREVDSALIKLIQHLIRSKGTPLILTLVGPTGAGKTEILQKILNELSINGLNATSIEMDNFYKDGSFREGKVLDRHVIHYELFTRCLDSLIHQRPAVIPRYNFLTTTSSHDPNSVLRPGQTPITVDPADVIFLEGNYPFHQPEVSPLISIKIVYLTDDPIRLKRKWRRDIDYRKKYDPIYFVNRYFRTQFLRAEEVYHPLMSVCDVVVDTSSAAIWVTPEISSKVDLDGFLDVRL